MGKRTRWLVCLPFILALGTGAQALTLPETGEELCLPLAEELLQICSGHTKENTALLFRKEGLKILCQEGYEKEVSDCSHTCAFTVGKGELIEGEKTRSLIVVEVRGTQGAEWSANVDFAPSQSPEILFDEDFLYAAQDVYLTLTDLIKEEKDPLLVITGYSRGAACANLLGLLCNETYGHESVVTYTFATPATLRGGEELYDANIFNFLNTADLVPKVPLSAWGFHRAGTDLLLSGDPLMEEKTEALAALFAEISPTPVSYYQDRHSLSKEGLSDEGITVFELFLLLAGQAEGGSETEKTVEIPELFGLELSDLSDLYPLLTCFRELTENEGGGGKQLLSQHMPKTYGELLLTYEKEHQER